MNSKVIQTVRDVEKALVELGLCQVVHGNGKHGFRVPPSFSRLVRDREGKHLALYVDHTHLPRNVTLEVLASEETIQALGRRLGKPTRVLNGTGLIYIVDLEPELIARVTL